MHLGVHPGKLFPKDLVFLRVLRKDFVLIFGEAAGLHYQPIVSGRRDDE